MANENKKLAQGEVNVLPMLMVKAIRNEATLGILLNAVGELTAHIQQKDPMEVKEALIARVEKLEKKITNMTFGYPEDSKELFKE